jgi:hypothetical protein
MDSGRFDALAKTLADGGSRRRLVRLLATLPLGAALTSLLPDAPDASAEDDDHGSSGRRHRRKAKHRHQTGNNKEHRKGKRKGKRKDTDHGKKPCAKSTCPAGICGSQPDGCGGTMQCGCGSTGICIAGACQPCTVSCPSGDPVACGQVLNAKMNAGGTVYVCPGTYRGGFSLLGTLAAGVTVIGAGQGDNPQVDTILDAGGFVGAGRVLLINAGVGTVVLERLRIKGGNDTTSFPRSGAGIRHVGTTLRMRDCTVTGNSCTGGTGGIHSGVGPTGSTLELTRCTVSDNHAINAAAGPGDGGGIFSLGTTTLTDCLIADNDANNAGGGIYHRFASAVLAGNTVVRGNRSFQGGGIYVLDNSMTIGADCRVTVNSADPNRGGGIKKNIGTITLLGAHPSPIVVDNCHENCVNNEVPGCAADGPVGRTCP